MCIELIGYTTPGRADVMFVKITCNASTPGPNAVARYLEEGHGIGASQTNKNGPCAYIMDTEHVAFVHSQEV